MEYAVITGAASGMGKIYANSLASKGFGLCMIDINEKGLAEVERELQELLGTQCPRIVREHQGFREKLLPFPSDRMPRQRAKRHYRLFRGSGHSALRIFP